VTALGWLEAWRIGRLGESVDANLSFTPICGQYHQGVIDGAGMARWDGAGLA
jgi:hypothetical protein